jgi:isopenicillin-N N-acyltransferase-like protein
MSPFLRSPGSALSSRFPFSRHAPRLVCGLACLLLIAFAAELRAADPAERPMGAAFRYPEGTEGKGELKYHGGIPVLVVEGTPEEIGKQIGTLGLKPGKKLANYPKDFVKMLGLEVTWPTLSAVGRSMLKSFPPDHLREFEAALQASGIERDSLVAANTMFDIKKFFLCSTLLVEADKSATGGPLLGRNLDFPTLGYLQDYTAVIVVRGQGKRAFASIGFPGAIGCLSGINDAGLSVAVLEVYSSKDDAAKFDVKGVPYALCFRRILEECGTVAEAEKLLRGMPRTTLINLAVADPQGGAVFEITNKSVEVRRPVDGLCPCTNHFRTEALSVGKECRRYTALEKAGRWPQLGVREVARKLHEVNQGDLTFQTMVFEPKALKLHLAFGGEGPSSAKPLEALDLGPLLMPAPAVQSDVVHQCAQWGEGGRQRRAIGQRANIGHQEHERDERAGQQPLDGLGAIEGQPHASWRQADHPLHGPSQQLPLGDGGASLDADRNLDDFHSTPLRGLATRFWIPLLVLARERETSKKEKTFAQPRLRDTMSGLERRSEQKRGHALQAGLCPKPDLNRVSRACPAYGVPSSVQASCLN